MTKAMERWWLIQQELAKELAGKLVPQASDKVIHDFRVCVKKLRALAYPNEINNRFKKQCPHLKQCYRLTGHLRNVQMMQQKLSSLGAWQINGFAEKQLNQLHQQHKKKLQHWLNKKQVHALVQEIKPCTLINMLKYPQTWLYLSQGSCHLYSTNAESNVKSCCIRGRQQTTPKTEKACNFCRRLLANGMIGNAACNGFGIKMAATWMLHFTCCCNKAN
jgi:CHAD domain-containing protein